MDKDFALEIPVQEHICSSLAVDCKHPPQKDHIMDWCVEVGAFFKNSRPSMKKEIVGAIKSEVEDRVHWVNWLSLNATRGRYLIFTLTGSEITIS